MTDLLEATGEAEAEAVLCHRVTKGVACTMPLPREGEPGYHPKRLYCDAHQPKGSAAKRKLKGNPDEGTPTKVINNNFTVKTPTSKTKVSGDLAAVEDAATQMLNLLPMVLAMFGDEVCPPEIQKSIPAVAHQLAVLSKYHPVIKKLLTGGTGTGETMVWLGLAVAISPVIITVLAHHNLVGDKLAEKLAYVAAMGGVFAAATAGTVDTEVPGGEA